MKIYRLRKIGPFQFVTKGFGLRFWTGMAVVLLVGLALFCSFASLFPRG